MKVTVLQVPYDSGHRGVRMGAGPLRLVDAGIATRLRAGGHDAIVATIELAAEPARGEITAAFEIARLLRDRVRAARSAGAFPLVLAGNCLSAAGILAAAPELSVLWFDAHADLNTPETTRSGFLDGMALSVLLGRCWRQLADDLELAPVPEARVCLLGARDLDAPESEFLATARIHRSLPGTPTTFELPAGAPVYLHIDLDVLDPAVGCANHFAAPGGFPLDELIMLIGRLGSEHTIAAAAITAYDPSADASGSIQEAALRIAVKVVDAVR